MLLMEKKEFDHWARIRSKGKKSYIVKTTLIGYFSVFFLFVIGNAIWFREHLAQYIRYNMNRIDILALEAFLGLAILSILSAFFWKFNENRFKKTIEAENKGNNA